MGKVHGLYRLQSRGIMSLPDGRHADGGCLYLEVRAALGGRSWVFIAERGGVRRELGIGSAKVVSLAKAREIAARMREALALGNDPRDVIRPPTLSFGALAERYIAERSFSNEKHRAQWRSTIQRYCAAILDRPVGKVRTEDALACLKPIWLELPETAARVRGRCERIIDAGTAHGMVSGPNPFRWTGHLEHLLDRQPADRGHYAAMPWADVPAFVARLRERPGVTDRALEWAILHASRYQEVALMTWEEIDFERRLWTIPGKRMKMRKEHVVPLTGRSIELLDWVSRIVEDSHKSLVFPGSRPGRPLSNMTFGKVLRLMGEPYTQHGFRSSFRDWAGDATEFPEELIEHALAHVKGGVEAAYRRGTAIERRRPLMEAWAEYCGSFCVR